jgi:hypothetical protein
LIIFCFLSTTFKKYSDLIKIYLYNRYKLFISYKLMNYFKDIYKIFTCKLIYTSNQIRTDHIYLEGRGYTNLTIIMVVISIGYINKLNDLKGKYTSSFYIKQQKNNGKFLENLLKLYWGYNSLIQVKRIELLIAICINA